MIDHIEIFVSNGANSRAFYDQALRPLGIEVKREVGAGIKALGYGDDARGPFFWVTPIGPPTGRLHVAFTAGTRAQVDAFHLAGLAAGGRDNGGPGLRPLYHPNYYGAFVLDPDGHNIEAVCHAPE
jgi:catechol 2,3-dioxygenase-like lactoylglutathione lyase family enzyme